MSADQPKPLNGSLPFSNDGEKGVLSALLQAPRKAFNLIPSLHPEAFYVPAHRMVFEILQELIARGEAADPNAAIDFVRLKQALTDRQQLVEVGGDQFLNELYGFTTAPDAVRWYAETILDHYGRRRLILACKQIGQLATDRTVSPDDLLGKADTELTEVSAAFVGSNATSQEMTVDELIGFDRENDPNSIMGNRWLSRGDSLLISGPTGIGKSSFAVQAVINWALGRSLFGISTTQKQRVLVIQSENNLGDLAVCFQDCCDRLEITRPDLSELNTRLTFVRQSSLTGEAFVHELRRLVNRHSADVVLIDPLFSYLGGDASKQEVMSKFLRNQIQPVLDQTGMIIVVIHDTAKPPKDAVNNPPEGFAHRSFGSVELLNWAREIVTFVPKDWGRRIFSLEFRKRARQARIADPDGKPTFELFLKHSAHGVVWEVCSREDVESLTEKTNKRGRPPSGNKEVAVTALRLAEADGGLKFEEWLKATNIPESSFKRVCRNLLTEKRVFKSVDGTYQLTADEITRGQK